MVCKNAFKVKIKVHLENLFTIFPEKGLFVKYQQKEQTNIVYNKMLIENVKLE